ncbi:MAG: PAS domain S-box protein [Actinomycetota bacterium]
MSSDLNDVLFPTISNIPVPCVISKRSTTEIVSVNDAAVEFFGYERREQLLSLDVATVTAPDDRPGLEGNYERTFDGGLATVKHYLRADGTTVESQLIARPLIGHPELAIAVIIDLGVTDSLRREESHRS